MFDILMCEVAAEPLTDEITKAWEDLAASVFNQDALFESFQRMLSNPLCLAIVSVLLVVVGFHIFAHCISTFILHRNL